MSLFTCKGIAISCGFALLGLVFAMQPSKAQRTVSSMPHRIFEAYPQAMLKSMQSYDTEVAAAASSLTRISPYYYIPEKLRWPPGTTLRVAFNGGNAALYAKIESAANTWISVGKANIHFAFRDGSGSFLTWSPGDTAYRGEIRIAFYSDPLNAGYWSAVGQNSTNQSVIGGRPGDASMNLDGFDKSLPSDWAATVMHEFGHALGFNHEHQSPVGGRCDFRFNDDPGYKPTLDSYGWYTIDDAGRRPGLYTYLGGKANYWPRSKVDANLQTIPASAGDMISPHDKKSIMEYYFPDFFFKAGNQSGCVGGAENVNLSPLDVAGLRLAYPAAPNDIRSTISKLLAANKAILSSSSLPERLKGTFLGRVELLEKSNK
jgi:hypothetical protein